VIVGFAIHLSGYVIATDGFHTWDEGEIEQFYSVHKVDTPAHLCMTLMLYTGAAKYGRGKSGCCEVGTVEYQRCSDRISPSKNS
jgi:hypothetical protein